MSTANLKPRLCHVVQGSSGYGFHLHGVKGEVGQSIRLVEQDSPAQQAGLLAGDKIIAVNGKNVEKIGHKEVVARIKEKSGVTDLLVISEEGYKFFSNKEIPITEELMKNAENLDVVDAPTNAETPIASDDDKLRPRLCKLTRTETGFGFNLHSEKGKQGRFIRTIDDGSPAEEAGLRAGDRIIEINGANIEADRHNQVVMAIKESGDSVNLLVVSPGSDEFFKSCKVTPTSAHVTGPLPTKSSEITSDTPTPPSTNGSVTTDNSSGVNLLEMDLQTLKERTRSKKKPAAPTSNWNNRQAMFNNL